MNLERMAGMLGSSAKGTWQTGGVFWKKGSVGSVQRAALWHEEPRHKHRVWNGGSGCSPILPETSSLQEPDTHLQFHAIGEKAIETLDAQRMRTVNLMNYLFAPPFCCSLYIFGHWSLRKR